MSEIAIKVENLSKQYRLGDVGTGSLKDDLKRWRYKMMGKEDPFLIIGEENNRTNKSKENYVWALKDINFEINKGDVVGIIGRNGAGKSTLLKILSRTTGPTTGTVKMKGRIASLLEVGTGFHGELSGRENIFLNGAILGMTKAEVKRKFDEIVDFAGVEKYIDTPVKRYSSGMYVRLAFGVAAYLEQEILIVDEVLAVGDAEFQKKALGKMGEVSTKEGRTVLFVSHNMAAVKQLCKKGILLNDGKIKCSGSIDIILNEYVKTGNSSIEFYSATDDNKKLIQILKVELLNEQNLVSSKFSFKEPIYVNFVIKNFSNERDVRYNIGLLDDYDRVIMVESLYVEPISGYKSYKVSLPSDLLTPTQFKLSITVDIPSLKLIDEIPENLSFEIVNNSAEIGTRGDKDFGFLLPKFKWLEK